MTAIQLSLEVAPHKNRQFFRRKEFATALLVAAHHSRGFGKRGTAASADSKQT